MPEIASRSPPLNDLAADDIGQEHDHHPANQPSTPELDANPQGMVANGPPPHDSDAAKEAVASTEAMEAQFQDLLEQLSETPLAGPSSYISDAAKSTEESRQAKEKELEYLLQELILRFPEPSDSVRAKEAGLASLLHELSLRLMEPSPHDSYAAKTAEASIHSDEAEIEAAYRELEEILSMGHTIEN